MIPPSCAFGYSFGFHSRASRCASALCLGVISFATSSRPWRRVGGRSQHQGFAFVEVGHSASLPRSRSRDQSPLPIGLTVSSGLGVKDQVADEVSGLVVIGLYCHTITALKGHTGRELLTEG